VKVRTAVVTSALIMGALAQGTAHADTSVHSPNAPRVVGQYHLVHGAPRHPEEDAVGWNCFVDGNGFCGTTIVRARGFARPNWHVLCLYTDGELFRGAPYIMCDDGSVYVVSERHRRR
jgi:hypothetical protein